MAVRVKKPPKLKVPWKGGESFGLSNPNATYSRGPTPGTTLGPQAIPVEPIYDAQIGDLAKTRTDTLLGLKTQFDLMGQQYGFRRDANNNVLDDPTNPYSRAAALQQSYDRAKRFNTNAMAARGQLYAGSLQNAQNRARDNNDRGRDALLRDYLSQAAAYDSAVRGAENSYSGGVNAAQGDRLNRALANRPAPESVPAAPPQAAPPASAPSFKTVAGKDSMGRPGVWHIYPDGRKVFVRR